MASSLARIAEIQPTPQLVMPPLSFLEEQGTLGRVRLQIESLQKQGKKIHPDFLPLTISHALFRIMPDAKPTERQEKLKIALTRTALDNMRLKPEDAQAALERLQKLAAEAATKAKK